MLQIRARIAHLLMAVMAAALIGPALAFAGGAIAFAGVDCGLGDPPWVETTVSNKDVLFTHNVLYASLTPGAHTERTVTHTTTWSASITVSVGAKADAGIIIAKASIQAGIALKGEGAVTDSSSVTTGVTNNSGYPHDYVIFEGTRTVKGTWTRYYCSAGTAKVSGSGTWKSWDAQYVGVLRCDNDNSILTNYGAWSVQYDAVKTC